MRRSDQSHASEVNIMLKRDNKELAEQYKKSSCFMYKSNNY